MSRRTKKQQAARPAPPPATAAPRSNAWWQVLVLLAASLAVYGNALGNGFVSDDDFQILANKYITDTKYIPKLLTSNVWSFAESEETGYYRPLFLLAYMAEYFAFGYDPLGWHVVSLLAHLAALIAAYLLLRALAGEKLAFIGALLFALHPIHVEAVVWVAVLTDLLCALALFAGMLAYHRAREGVAPRPNLLLSAACFFGGLLVKETAIVFPALVVAYEFFFRRESPLAILRGWLRYLPFAAALAVYLPLRIHALGKFAPSSGAHFKLSAWEMCLSVPVLMAQYIWKLFAPVNLNYYYHYVPVRQFGWKTAAALLLVLGVVALMVWLRARRPLLSFSIAWFLLTLAPVLSIPNVGENVFTERYLYIPSLGFCAVVAWGWRALYDRAAQAPAERRVLAVALAAVCLLYAVIILRRNPDWHGDIRLFTRTAEQSPESPTIQMNLGYIWFVHGRTDLAMDYYNRSLALDPDRAVSHNNLGNALTSVGRHDEAIAHLLRATELKKDYAPAWVNLGLVYAAKKEWDNAISSYTRALEIKPEFPDAFTALGLAYWNKGQPQQAIAAYRQALAAKPDFMEALINLASALSETGQPGEASEMLLRALRVNPSGPHAAVIHYNLGVNYERNQQFTQALAEYESALIANPTFTQARQKVDYFRPRVGGSVTQLPSPPPPKP
jgi:tetratricopeptide (TPR) repeat protein